MTELPLFGGPLYHSSTIRRVKSHLPCRGDLFLPVATNYNQGTLQVLFEDNHLLAVVKPPGLPTMGVQPDRPSLLAEARRYIKQRYQKPGNVYLGAMSRLDAPVSGVILFARTSKAAARLTEQFRSRSVEKSYWALVEQPPDPACGELIDWLAEDPRHRSMRLTTADQRGAKEAPLSYRTLKTLPSACWLEIDLQTGRKHQIRVQLSACGSPIVGDRKYGARRAFPVGIALHARRLVFHHPVRKSEQIELEAPLPASWRRLGIDVV